MERLQRCLVLLAVIFSAVPAARAASDACTADADCTAPQVCDLDVQLCVWEARDAASLAAAITAANADAARDVIVVGPANPGPAPELVEIHLDTPVATDTTLGPLAVPVVSSAITIVGQSAELSVIDIDADLRLFVLAPDAVTNLRPDLLLQKLTLRDARPGANGAGAIVGAGAVHVTASPTTATAPALPELPLLVAEDVRFTSGRGASAGAVSVDGAPARFLRCTFDDNEATDGAGAVSATTGAVISASTFSGNRGEAGAVLAGAATRVDETGAEVEVSLHITASTFDGNRGSLTGAVRSLATTTINTTSFTNNRATGDGAVGGAVAVRSLRVQGGRFDHNTARGGGGAIALLDADATAVPPVPESLPAQIADAAFVGNETLADGGAILAAVVPLTLTGNTFRENVARLSGGAVALQGVVERNGAAPDVVIRGNTFSSNLAHPAVSLTATDTTVDELGDDTGAAELRLTGAGSAVSVSATSHVEASGNCFLGNGPSAWALANGATAVDASGNWWGDASGPGPAGAGDVAGAAAGLDLSSPLPEAPAFCATASRIYPLLFVGASVSTDGAAIGTDYRVLDDVRGIQVLAATTGDLVPDMRLGRLGIVVTGVNDADVEGAETFRLRLEACTDPCTYSGQGFEQTFTIADNGDGVVGEGEGEGEPECVESLSLSAASVLLPDTGEPSEASLTVTNHSACEVKLFRPFVQAGASQGFGLKPILADALVLPEGGALKIVVTYTPPEEDDGVEGPPTGALIVETERGTLVEVALGLENNCACASSARGRREGAPAVALVPVALLASLLVRRRRPRGR